MFFEMRVVKDLVMRYEIGEQTGKSGAKPQGIGHFYDELWSRRHDAWTEAYIVLKRHTIRRICQGASVPLLFIQCHCLFVMNDESMQISNLFRFWFLYELHSNFVYIFLDFFFASKMLNLIGFRHSMLRVANPINQFPTLVQFFEFPFKVLIRPPSFNTTWVVRTDNSPKPKIVKMFFHL